MSIQPLVNKPTINKIPHININNPITKNNTQFRKHNCIQLKINNIKNNKPSNSGIINLDSGNQIPFPVISGKFYKQLKSLTIIPKHIKLKKSNYNVESANQSPMKISGILQYPLVFSNDNLKFTFNDFLIMDNLSTDFNFGKAILDILKTKWDFGKPNVTILDSDVKLCSQTRETLENIKFSTNPSIINSSSKLYPKHNIYLEPHSVSYIPLKARQKGKSISSQGNDLVIEGNSKFERRKLVQLDRINISSPINPTIAIFNTQDTAISISKNDVIAYATPCDDETQFYANILLLQNLKDHHTLKSSENNHEESDKSSSIKQLHQETNKLLMASITMETGNNPTKLSPQDIKHFDTSL